MLDLLEITTLVEQGVLIIFGLWLINELSKLREEINSLKKQFTLHILWQPGEMPNCRCEVKPVTIAKPTKKRSKKHDTAKRR